MYRPKVKTTVAVICAFILLFVLAFEAINRVDNETAKVFIGGCAIVFALGALIAFLQSIRNG